VHRSVDGGKSFSLMMGGLPTDANGDVPGNFYMKVISDFGDANGKTFLTLVNQTGGSRVYKWVENGSAGNSWVDLSGSVLLKSGVTQSGFPVSLNMITADPKHPGQYGAVGSGGRVFRKAAGSAQWVEAAPAPMVGIATVGFDPVSTTTFWAGSRSASSGGHVFASTDSGATWTARSGSGATALPDVPVFVVKVDPNDSKTIYAGTELGLYRSTDAGASWNRYGVGLPLVAVTDLSITLDSSAIRISTYGRGFWELYPSFGAPSGVHGDGDFDGNGVIDGFDLVSFATVLGFTTSDANYTAKGNLVGNSNSIDSDDLLALIAKMGARP